MISDWRTGNQTVDGSLVSLKNQWTNYPSAHPLLMSGIMGVGEYVLGGHEVVGLSLWWAEWLGDYDLPAVPPSDIATLDHLDSHYITFSQDANVLRGNVPNQIQIVSGTTYTVNPQDLEVLIDVNNPFTVNLPNSQAWLAAQNPVEDAELVIQDISGSIDITSLITILPQSPETLNGLSSLTLSYGYAGMRLRPIQQPAGVITNQGWVVR